MKKLLFSIFVAGSTALSFSQQNTIDFENFALSQADTFYNGSDNVGTFTINGGASAANFSNVYTDFGGGFFGWNGFSVSNMTDALTPGYANQYSSFSGSGANSSQKYAVLYPEALITFSNIVQMDSVKINNTTYAAKSMISGDAYAKVFGSPLNAAGVDDGTNGEDFLRVWIIGMNTSMTHTDSVLFYLADFQGTNAYILDSFTNVDLSPLGVVKHLTFRFESTDMSFGYINTPTYLALDNLNYSETLATNELSKTAFEIYPNPVNSVLTVKGSEGKLTLSNLEGKILFSSNHSEFTQIDFSTFEAGIYFINIENKGLVSTQKIIK